MDEFEQKMQEMANARAELHLRLAESEQKLQDIDAKMDAMVIRQRTRMNADSRASDKVIATYKLTENRRKISTGNFKKPITIESEERTQMITRELSAEEISVKPREE